MPAAFTLYLVGLGLVGVGFFTVYVYYEFDTAAGRPYRERGVTQRGITLATLLTLGLVLTFGFLGDVNIFASAGVGYPTIGLSFVLAAGFLGLNSCYTLGRRWRRLHPDNDAPTGSLGPGEVACTGAVTDATVGAAPVTGRGACCWSWSVEVLNPYGVGSNGDQYVTVDGGDGGVVFTIDDGSGPVRIDPEGATLDLGATRTRSLEPDEQPPEAFQSPAPDAERTHGDKSRTYEESIVAPGDQVAIAGTARTTDDGLVVGGGDTHVAIGSLSTVATRYRNRAAMYGIAGLLGVVVGVRWLATLYGVSV